MSSLKWASAVMISFAAPTALASQTQAPCHLHVYVADRFVRVGGGGLLVRRLAPSDDPIAPVNLSSASARLAALPDSALIKSLRMPISTQVVRHTEVLTLGAANSPDRLTGSREPCAAEFIAYDGEFFPAWASHTTWDIVKVRFLFRDPRNALAKFDSLVSVDVPSLQATAKVDRARAVSEVNVLSQRLLDVFIARLARKHSQYSVVPEDS